MDRHYHHLSLYFALPLSVYLRALCQVCPPADNLTKKISQLRTKFKPLCSTAHLRKQALPYLFSFAFAQEAVMYLSVCGANKVKSRKCHKLSQIYNKT